MNRYVKEKAKALNYLKITKGVGRGLLILGVANVGSSIYEACTNGTSDECRKTSIVDPMSFIFGLGVASVASRVMTSARFCFSFWLEWNCARGQSVLLELLHLGFFWGC